MREGAGEEGGRNTWRSWRLPCFKRKIHPAEGPGAASTTGLPAVVVAAPAVGGCRAPALPASPSGRLQLSPRGSTDSSMDLSADSSLYPSMGSLDSVSGLAWFMSRRGEREQFQQLREKHQLYFLHCITSICMEAKLKEEPQLDGPFSKAELLSALVEVMEYYQSRHKLGGILSSALRTLHHLRPRRQRLQLPTSLRGSGTVENSLWSSGALWQAKMMSSLKIWNTRMNKSIFFSEHVSNVANSPDTFSQMYSHQLILQTTYVPWIFLCRNDHSKDTANMVSQWLERTKRFLPLLVVPDLPASLLVPAFSPIASLEPAASIRFLLALIPGLADYSQKSTVLAFAHVHSRSRGAPPSLASPRG
ncbi:uncharacterized protein LOC140702565 [Pogona vitticeps]